jgi:ABC-type multidrug transport system fused ATPase/permease subunit
VPQRKRAAHAWHHGISYLAFAAVSKAPNSASQAAGAPIGLLASLAEIYRHVSEARRRQFLLVLLLMLLGAFAELATIGAVLPFLTLLADPQKLARYPIASELLHASGAVTLNEQLLLATVLFGIIVVASGAIRFELARTVQHFSYQLAHELLVEVQRRFLFQPYSFHVQRNTSTLVSALEKTEILACEVLISLMQAAIAAFTALFIVGALIAVDPITAIVAAATFAAIYLCVSLITKERLARNSAAIASGFDERLRIVQESLGGIRDVIIDGSQAAYLGLFDQENSKLNRARANTGVISSAPRFIIETVGIVAMAAIAFFEAERRGGLAAALPILGAVALGAQRLLPLIQQIFRGWSTASGYMSVVGQTVDLLTLPIPQDEQRPMPLPLRDQISIEGISFSYPSRRKPALEQVSVDIPAGSAVALVGETGSGKSTLADLLMGLINADAGRILIDGVPLTGSNRRRWQRSIAHVPQSIFLADASIAGNIALGCPGEAIDLKRLEAAAKSAQLHEFVASLPDGYETFVGERGIRISGGQRQRLGIARAIYKQTPLLVLDEATSALDERTEHAVIAALDELRSEGRTIVIVAHRISTIRRCDQVVRLEDGRVVEVGSFRDVFAARETRR